MKKLAVDPVPTPTIASSDHVLERLARNRLLELVLGHLRFTAARSVHTPS